MILSRIFILALYFASPIVAQPFNWSILSGVANTAGGSGSNPRSCGFNQPISTCIDPSGNLLVIDLNNHIIRKISPQGIVTSLAGLAGIFGFANGTGTDALFNNPRSVVSDSLGNIYVADLVNQVVRRITPAGLTSTFSGQVGNQGNQDGFAEAATFHLPLAAAVDSFGNVFVVDSGNHAIRKIFTDGSVSTFAGLAGENNFGNLDGLGAAARFQDPVALCIDSSNNLFVADTGNNKIKKISPAGLVTSLPIALFEPSAIAVNAAGELFVSQNNGHSIRKIIDQNTLVPFVGQETVSGSADGIGSIAKFKNPTGFSVDRNGNLYVADQLNHIIRRVTPAGLVTTVAGTTGDASFRNSSGSGVLFSSPRAVAAAPDGGVLIADADSHTIRRVNQVGATYTLTGIAFDPGSTDGSTTEARFDTPSGIVAVSTGDIFVSDTGNHTIRKIASTGIVSTLAGSAGVSGISNGDGSLSRFNRPAGIAADSAGNLYVADRSNHCIRKISPTGNVTTLAGILGSSGSDNGPAASAKFFNPTGITLDSFGNLYIADQSNHTIRKISTTGAVSTFAGSPGILGSADGNGSAARFNLPAAVTCDAADQIYVAEQGSSKVRKITLAGEVTTVSSVDFSLNAPRGIATMANGNLILVNSGANTILTGIPQSGLLPDADNDGLSDLQELAQGLPRLGSNAAYGRPISLSLAATPAPSGPNYPQLTFRAWPGISTGYAYQVEESTDLVNWTDINMQTNQVGLPQPTADGIPVDLVTVRSSTSTTARDKNFMRLRIDVPWPPSRVKNAPLTVNTLKDHCNEAVMSLLPTNTFTKNIYDSYSTTGQVAWSRFAWTNKIDLSKVARDDLRNATLVSPRHVLMAEHYAKNSNDQIMFHDRSGNIYTRTIRKIITIRSPENLSSDIRVGSLDQDMPPGFFYKVLPPRADWEAYLKGTLVFSTNQFKQLTVRKIDTIGNGANPQNSTQVTFSFPTEIPSFYITPTMVGDSSNPAFLMINGEPVLIEAIYTLGANSTSAGPFYSVPLNYNAINQAMIELGGGYQLTPININ